MPKKDITKIDPRKELSPYLNHQTSKKKNKNRKKVTKVSASLSGLQSERRKSLFKGLGLILGISVIAIIIFGYYVSPLANIDSVEVKGAPDLPTKEVVANSGIKSDEKIFDYLFNSKKVDEKLSKKYPEVDGVKISVKHLNNLVLQINEYPTIGYIKDGSKYRKILSNDDIGSQSLNWKNINQEKPIFVGYTKKMSLKNDLKLFNSFPEDFRQEVKLLTGKGARTNQIILVMKDGNVVIGNTATLKNKILYYNSIKAKAGKNSLIDLEVGAFSRPLTKGEMKAYGIN